VTPLEELIETASGEAASVSTLLRKLKVIAARLGTVQLEEWVDHELSGYPSGAAVPDYRGPFEREVRGNFVGPFGSSMTSVPVPPSGFPREMRDGWLFKHEFREPIAEIETLSRSSETLQVPWPADMITYTNRLLETGEARLYPRMGLIVAWKPVMPTQLASIVDSVRTRVLGLALELEAVQPDAGRHGVELTDNQQLRQMVTNVYGGNVAIGSTGVAQQSVVVPSTGDLAALRAALLAAGIAEGHISVLEQALKEDREAGEGEPGRAMGPRVQAWLAKVATQGGSAAGKGAAGAAGGLALKALAGYFGLL
jgi:hypothetical protein